MHRSAALRSVRARVRVERDYARRVLQRPAAHEHTQISFSQMGEDVIVRFLFDQMGVAQPSYLDIGAYHPFQFSNTAAFHATGSCGINVDPDPDAIARFRLFRPGDINLNVGCSDEPGSLTFYRLSAPTLNTFSKEAADNAITASGGRLEVAETLDVEVRS